MGAWDFNLQIPYQAPAYTAQGLSAIGQGVAGFIQGQQQKAKEAEQLQYENLKNDTVVANLATNKLITPEQYHAYQVETNPKTKNALAQGYATTTAFNLIQAKNTPQMVTLPGGPGVPSQSIIYGAGFNQNVTPAAKPTLTTLQPEPGSTAKPQDVIVDNKTGAVTQNVTQWDPSRVTLPGDPKVGSGLGMYAHPGEPDITGFMSSPQQFTRTQPEAPLGITKVTAADGTSVNVLAGGPMKGVQVLKPTDTFSGLKTMISQMTPEQIQERAAAANKIAIPQSDGSMLYFDDPSKVKKGEKDSIAQYVKDLAAVQEMLANNVSGGGTGDNAATPVSAFSEAQLKGIQDGFNSRLKNLIPTKPNPGTMTDPTARVTVYDSKGKAFTVPASQLQQALQSGYTTSQ